MNKIFLSVILSLTSLNAFTNSDKRMKLYVLDNGERINMFFNSNNVISWFRTENNQIVIPVLEGYKRFYYQVILLEGEVIKTNLKLIDNPILSYGDDYITIEEKLRQE
jgi:hypothetical protein